MAQRTVLILSVTGHPQIKSVIVEVPAQDAPILRTLMPQVTEANLWDMDPQSARVVRPGPADIDFAKILGTSPIRPIDPIILPKKN